MLKSEAEPIHTKFLGNDHKIINCTFEGGEGPALHYEGGNNILVHNSAFIFNDWVGQGEDTATVLNKHTGEGVNSIQFKQTFKQAFKQTFQQSFASTSTIGWPTVIAKLC